LLSWKDTELTRLLGISLPIVQAPMAGGWSTPRMVADVCEAGGLGSIAGAALTPDKLREEIREVRSMTGQPFAVNLFAPLPTPTSRGLEAWAEASGVPAPSRVPAAAPFDDQLSIVVEERVRVFSFTFGIPELSSVDAFTIGTATTPAEAGALSDAGVGAVVAQGFEAGGHRGTFLAPVEQSLLGTLALVPQVVDAVSVPVIAAGGIMDGRGVAAALALGAAGAQLGTAFLASDEAGTGAEYRAALGRPTAVTRVLTGRYARAVRTPLVDRLESSGAEPPDYPLPRLYLTEPPMLVGQGGALARSQPTAQIIADLDRETSAALSRLI
jgi:nitronate monooxygenase